MTWDEFYKNIRDSNPLIWPDVQVVRLLSKLKLNDKVKVIDLGCGEGRNIRLLCEKGFDVTALDQSKHALNIVKTLYHLDDKQIICDNISSGIKTLNDNYYSLVLCWGLMHYITDTALVLKEIKRILKKGSSAILSFSTTRDKRDTADEVKCYFSQENIEELLNGAGLKIDDIGLIENHYIKQSKVESFYWILASK